MRVLNGFPSAFLSTGILLPVLKARARPMSILPKPPPVSPTEVIARMLTPRRFSTRAVIGDGASQIGPGTTVHLCGTFTASAGASGYLSFQGSGTSGNPITLHFETNALLQAPYWGTGAAIFASGLSYVMVDGGTNGTIQANRSRTPRAACLGGSCVDQQPGVGVIVSACANTCEVKS